MALTTPLRFSLAQLTWTRLLTSLLVVGLGVAGAQGLTHVDADLRVMYQEYTLAAVDLAHISSEVIRYRATMIRALDARTRTEFEVITATLPAQRAGIQHAVDRYAAASLRVSRSGRSEPRDLQIVRDSLEAYFSEASKTLSLLVQVWGARSSEHAAALRHQAEVHAANIAGPKMIQLSLALDRLLDTVTEVAEDMRDEGSKTTKRVSFLLTVGCLLLAVFNLIAPALVGSDKVSMTSSAESSAKNTVVASAERSDLP
jgi:chemoreceptor-like protein with four helix bundle sensory module